MKMNYKEMQSNILLKTLCALNGFILKIWLLFRPYSFTNVINKMFTEKLHFELQKYHKNWL
jgi:hypothetical protein